MPTIRVRPRHPITGSPMVGERVTVKYTQIVFGADESTIGRSSYLNTNAQGFADFLLDSSASTNPANAQVRFSWNGVSGLLATVPATEGPNVDGTVHYWELEQVIDPDQLAPLPTIVGVQSVTGASVDNTDPRNPVVGGGSGAVSSVFTRTGAVVAASGDYAAFYQPLDTDLTTIAAIDASTAGTLVTDGAGWIRKTYAQLKTALGLVKADVGLGNVDNTSDVNKPVSTAQQTAITAEATARGNADALLAPLAGATFTGPVVVPTPTLSSQAATKAYVDGLVTGLYDLRGTYDASGNTFPTSGGSGTAGAVVKGDTWVISVAGTLGTKAVVAGDVVTSVVDTPGQTAGNWSIIEHDLGYTPLNAASNLSDLGSATTARTNLGLGTAAVANTGTASGNVPLLSTGGVLPIGRLATGTPDGTKFVRDDGTLVAPAGGTDTVTTVPTSGASQTITVPASASVSEVLTLTANCTLTFDTSAAPSGKAWQITLELKQDGTGSRTVAWPPTVAWPANTPPTLTTTAGHVDVVSLVSMDNGVTWQGALAGSDYPTPAVPGAPTLSAAAGNTTVTLTWPAVTAIPSVTNYKVYKGSTSGGETLLTTLGNVLTYTDTGLTNGTVYYYKVSAVNALGESALSTERSVTPSSTSLPSISSATLQARFAGDLITSPPSSGSLLATWTDVSGNSHDATQATGAKQPTYVTGVAGGKPIVRFDGSRYMASALTWPTTDYGVFVVFKPANLTSAQGVVGGTSNGGLEVQLTTSGTIQLVQQNVALLLGPSTSGTVNTSGFHVVAGTCSNDQGSGTYIKHITIDGNDTTATSGNGALTSSIPINIGAAVNAGSINEGLNGDIAEVLIYSSSVSTGMSSADRKTIEAYLGSKYGITIVP